MFYSHQSIENVEKSHWDNTSSLQPEKKKKVCELCVPLGSFKPSTVKHTYRCLNEVSIFLVIADLKFVHPFQTLKQPNRK